jgi:molecular chaperone Hsp33
MRADQPDSASMETFPIINHFVRGRNVLVSTADMSLLFSQCDRHLEAHHVTMDEAQLAIFRAFLSGFALHTAAYPRTAILAWTIHFQDPHLNVFLGGDASAGTVTGRLFTEGLKHEDSNIFYQDLVLRGKPPHRSIVPFEGNDPRGTMEFYYQQSEQRPGRFFNLGDDQYALVSAHPDFDQAWFRNLDTEAVADLSATETLSHIETRPFRWQCECHRDRIEKILLAPMADDPEALFGDEEIITVNCPRCAARYRISRESMEAVVAAYMNSGTSGT